MATEFAFRTDESNASVVGLQFCIDLNGVLDK